MANMPRDYFGGPKEPWDGDPDEFDDSDESDMTPVERIKEAVEYSADWAEGMRLIHNAIDGMDPAPRAKAERVLAFLLTGAGGPRITVR